MKKIVEIDNKRYYGKVLPQQDLVILFKRPQGANDAKCESLLKDLLSVVTNGGDNLSSSDIISHTEWNNEDNETIGEFLYVHNRESEIVSEGLYRVCSRKYDELNEGNQRIALILKTQPNYNCWKYIAAAVFILCLILIVRYISNHFEEKQVASNQELYSNDFSLIVSLQDEFKRATSDSHSYAPYITGSEKKIIADQLDSLREAANRNAKKLRESGDYSPVISDVKTYKASIDQLVENAKNAEQKTLDNTRLEKNRKAYEEDVLTIESLEDDLSNVVNNQAYSSYVSNTQVRIIKAFLDSLKKTSDSLFNAANLSGNYSNLSIDSVSIRYKINKISESAQKEFEWKNKTPLPPKSVTLKQATNSNNMARYNQLVDSANEDYTKYYMNGDKAAARRAYNNYIEALRIQNNSIIANRCNNLKTELGL